jgi:hypothetical protein
LPRLPGGRGGPGRLHYMSIMGAFEVAGRKVVLPIG